MDDEAKLRGMKGHITEKLKGKSRGECPARRRVLAHVVSRMAHVYSS